MTEGICRECGCTGDRACPNGCFWVEPDLCSACVNMISITLPPLALLAVYDNVRLALKHPANQGASRVLAEKFVATVEHALIEAGMIRPQTEGEEGAS